MLNKSLKLEESYQELMKVALDYAVFLLDEHGVIVSWSKAAERIYRAAETDYVGKHVTILFPEDTRADGKPENFIRQAKDQDSVEDEGWRVRKDGSRFWAGVVLTALRNQDGKLSGFVNVTRDLTERKLAEDKIERLNNELRGQLYRSQTEIDDYKHALDESSIVAITDQKGTITHVNDNFCKISKYSREELLGQDHQIINSGFHPKEFIRNLWVTIANGKIWRGELRNRAKDGTIYWVDTTIVPFLNEKGKPYQYLAIRSDITQRKLAEEQLYQAKEYLEVKVKERTYELTQALEREKELNEMKSRFVSMASHEFRTPLSAILSSVSLLEHYTKPEQAEKRGKHIDRIKSSVRNLTSILDDFLSLEKLEHGKVEVHSTEFDLREFLDDVIDEMDGMVKRKHQHINFQFTGEPVVYQDKKILRNVLLNLLSNAVKYSPEDKEIRVTTTVENSAVLIAVKDEGIGIPEAAQKDLFTKFYRAGNALNIQGTGLGLHIVKRYVELLEGDISFASLENRGTTFTVKFPAKNSAPQQKDNGGSILS